MFCKGIVEVVAERFGSFGWMILFVKAWWYVFELNLLLFMVQTLGLVLMCGLKFVSNLEHVVMVPR